ncbi:MAG: coiled-coil domain-containing protein [Nitrospinaceae bacterium]
MQGQKVAHWIEKISSEQNPDDLLVGKKEYQKLSGEIFQDDKSFESRMGAFLEWYAFDRKVPGSMKTPLMNFLENKRDQLAESDQKFLESLTKSVHGIFFMTKVRDNHLRVKELFEDKDFRVNGSQKEVPFSKNDVFEGRLVPVDGNFYYTLNFCYHPPQTLKFIRRQVKAVREKEAKIFKQLKSQEKQLGKLEKQLASQTAKLDKVKRNLEAASTDVKRAKLSQERDVQQDRVKEIENQVKEAASTLERFKDSEIETNLPQRRFQLMQTLSYMSLKWERSRQIDIFDIYRD